MTAFYWTYFTAQGAVVLVAKWPQLALVPLEFMYDQWLVVYCRMMRHTGDPRYYRTSEHSK